MRFILIIAAVLTATTAGSADYAIISQQDLTIINEGGTITIIQQPPIIGRLANFAARHGSETPLEIAEILSVCRYPKVMAAIAARESNFNPDAIGKDGEISMFQLLDPPEGLDPEDNQAALDAAIQLLEEKVAATGSLHKAIRAYNGKGEKSRHYRDDVLKLINEI